MTDLSPPVVSQDSSPPEGHSHHHIVPDWLRVPGLVGVLLALFLVLIWPGLKTNTPTVDEFAHVPAGYLYWRTGDFTLYNKTPPLVRLVATAPLLLRDRPPRLDTTVADTARGAWAPWMVGTHFMRANRARYFDHFFLARVPIVVLGMLGGLVVFAWSRHLFTTKGGLFSLFVYCLSPTVLAHAGLATTDITFAGLWVAALFVWALFLETPTWPRLVGASAIAALAALSKYSGLLLLPVFGLIAVSVFALAPPRGHRLPPFSNIRTAWLRKTAGGIATTAVLALVVCLVIGLLYRFAETPTALRDLPGNRPLAAFMHDSSLGVIPFPLPAEYLRGLDQQLADAERGDVPAYLLGEWSREGWPSYFLITFVVKTPVAILALFVMLGIFVRHWGEGLARRRRVMLTLLFPALMYAVVLSASNLHLGVRYLLPCYVLLFVALGGTREIVGRRPGQGLKVVFVLLCLWLVATTVAVRPHFLAYFNEFAGGPTRGDRVLVDSNIDWGQDLGRVAEYLEARNINEPVALLYFGHVDPALYGIEWQFPRAAPLAPDEQRGLVIASVNYVHGYPYPTMYTSPPQWIASGTYRWLSTYEPIERIGYSLLVYDFSASPPPSPSD